MTVWPGQINTAPLMPGTGGGKPGNVTLAVAVQFAEAVAVTLKVAGGVNVVVGPVWPFDQTKVAPVAG